MFFLFCLIKCSSGFIVPNPKALTVICPDCRHTFCRSCKKQWKQQHLNQSCEQFALWEKDHSLDYAEQLLNKHLEEFGIGLLHFTLFALLIIISFFSNFTNQSIIIIIDSVAREKK